MFGFKKNEKPMFAMRGIALWKKQIMRCMPW